MSINYQISFLEEPDKVVVDGEEREILKETKEDYYVNWHGRIHPVYKKTVISNKMKHKINKAIERLKCFEPEEGYHLAFSGGKDSIVIYKLAEMANVKFEAVHNHTTVDTPQLVWFIRDFYKDLKVNYPKLNMWKLIEKKLIPPTRQIRYCCEKLKEGSGKNRFVVTGVRWAESAKRKNKRTTIELNVNSKKYINKFNDNDTARMMLENCQRKRKHILNPVVDWTDEEIWSFILFYDLPYVNLYDNDYDRLGCIGCPLATVEQREKEFEMFPEYKETYIKVFDRMIENRKIKSKKTKWKNGKEVFNWWMYGGRKEG